jgi:dynein heavy chain, axonemal
MVKHFTQLEEIDFSECKPLLKPMMHIVCMIWGRSLYYCHSAKLIVLLRQICNLIIQQAKRYLDPSSIFSTDIDEAMLRISFVIEVLRYFRAIFDEFKENLGPFFRRPDIHPLVNWTFHPNAVFERFNAFLNRLLTIQGFFFTIIEFLKLEKVEIGGLKGRVLSQRILTVSAEFNQCFALFASKTYDVLDPDDPSFDNDFLHFQDAIQELDLKLASVFCQAFDDSYNLESIYKLINIVGTVLDRPKIKAEFTNKYPQIIRMLDEEITMCEEIYEMQMDYYEKNGCLFIDKSAPPVTGALRWVLQLGSRATYPIENFQQLQHP